jgi:histone H3/H4
MANVIMLIFHHIQTFFIPPPNEMDNNYSNEILKISVARACTALGFKSIHGAALESLADVMRHYIQSIGTHARDHAEASERVFAGIQDVIQVVEYPVKFLFLYDL